MSGETRPFLMTDDFLATERKETSILVMVCGKLSQKTYIHIKCLERMSLQGQEVTVCGGRDGERVERD